MDVVGRDDAKACGLVRYFTGEPCPQGHRAERYTKTTQCCECTKVAHRAYITRRKAEDPEFSRQRDKLSMDWAKTHPEQRRNSLAAYEKTEQRIVRKKATTIAWRKANPDKVAAHNKRANAKNHERFAATRAVWYQRNKARLRDLAREYRKSNREKIRAQFNDWAIRNPQKFKAAQAVSRLRRRARDHAIGGTITADDILAIFRKYHGTCVSCGSTDRIEIDHILAVAKGGSNDRANLQLLCADCNRSKGAKDFAKWSWEQGRLL